jgi:lipopolysaccharide transport system permease protein
MNGNANILNYLHLIRRIAISDFKLRYKNTVLGFFWSLLEPLLMLIVLYLVFTNLSHGIFLQRVQA